MGRSAGKCFNPTLVRLRSDSLARRFDFEFQSHAGSIEVHVAAYLAKYVYKRFQSHAGSIEVQWWAAKILLTEVVSIPRWFD